VPQFTRSSSRLLVESQVLQSQVLQSQVFAIASFLQLRVLVIASFVRNFLLWVLQLFSMSYQVIARKWRPQTFGDLVGQGHVTETLQNAIRNNRVAHAYIFSGARGVGKTTAARILAKALNCVNGPTPEPCGVCDSCKEIASGSSLDVIEIDAASNRGIDQIHRSDSRAA